MISSLTTSVTRSRSSQRVEVLEHVIAVVREIIDEIAEIIPGGIQVAVPGVDQDQGQFFIRHGQVEGGGVVIRVVAGGRALRDWR